VVVELDAVRHERGDRVLRQLRGAGDVLGTRQHGLPLFRVARFPDDEPLLERAHARAEEVLERDPELAAPEHAFLREAAAVEEPIPA